LVLRASFVKDRDGLADWVPWPFMKGRLPQKRGPPRLLEKRNSFWGPGRK
jgi:hypothetical protein